MTGRSERRLNNPMVILLKVSTCYMPKEAEPSFLNKMGDWTTAVGAKLRLLEHATWLSWLLTPRIITKIVSILPAVV